MFARSVFAKPFAFTNLNEASLWYEKKLGIPSDERPYKDPDFAQKMEDAWHEHLGIEWSIDGYLQDRTNIRRGTYVEAAGIPLHTGIDVNLGTGTTVYFPTDGIIVYAGTDHPNVGGWGGHVIQLISFRKEPHALIYAHLGEIECKEGEYARPGFPVGAIGDKTQNGYWRPHLHLQLFSDIDNIDDWEKFSKAMDGYVKIEERSAWARKCPDPTPLIFNLA